VHESSHSDCSMPDLSSHKAHTGIQICQARKLRLITLGRYHQAGQELLRAQYLIFNLLGLPQHFYFYTGFPAHLLVPRQPYRQKKYRYPRGLELQKIQGSQDVDEIHVERIWGNLDESCN